MGAAAGDMELVAVLSAEDEASPVIKNVQGNLEGVAATGATATDQVSSGSKDASRDMRTVGTAASATSSALSALGLSGAASMLRLASSLTRVRVALQGLTGAGGLAALAGPVGIALAAGAAVAGIAALVSNMNRDRDRGAPTVVSVSVDARGTVTEHRALANEIARQVEASVSTRARFGGID